MSKVKDKNRRSKHRRHISALERLESRQLYSVVAVTPQNFTSVVNNSNAGSTFNFAPGNYSVPANATLPSGTYVGNGAAVVVAGTHLAFSPGSDVSGFTFTGAPILCQGGTFNIHGDTFTGVGNSQQGIVVIGDSNSQYVNNTFTSLGDGIYGYPGSNNTYSSNRFDNVAEDIHLASATCDNITVSNNTITRAQRYAIEIQLAATNLTVSGNSITQWLANGNQGAGTVRTGISIASSGTGISVTNNQIIQNLAPGTPFYVNTGAGLEIMGDNDVTVTGNTFYGWNGPYLNGVRAGAKFTIANNTIYGLDNNGGDPMGYALAPIVDPTDKVLPLSAYPGSTSVQPTPVTTPAPTRVPLPNVPAGITATANGQSGQIAVNAPAGSNLGIYASTLNPSTAVNLGTTSGTSTTIGGIPLDWQVTVTVTTGGTTYTLPSVQVLNSAIPMSGPFNPAVVQAVIPPVVSSPTPTPVVTTPAPSPSPAIPAGLTASAGTNGSLAITLPTGITTATLSIYASTLAPSTATNVGTIAGNVTVTGIPDSWDVTPVVGIGGTNYTLPEVQAFGGTTAALAPVIAPATAPVASAVTAAPTNFAATSPSSSEVDLSWTDNTSGTGTYILQRRATNGSLGFQTVATLPAGTTSYDDTAVNAEWEYNYQLTAVVKGVSSSTAAVHVQAQAAPVIPPVVSTPVVPPGVTPPVVTPVTSVPTNFVAVSSSSSKIVLSWTDNTSDTGTYILQRRATNGSLGFQTLATLPAGTTSYNDSAVKANWEYNYQLTAVVNGVSSSVAAVHVQAQAAPVIPPVVSTPVVVPPVVIPPVVSAAGTAAPTNFVATSSGGSEVDLSWTDNTNGSATYVLQRRAVRGRASFQTIATVGAGITSYSDQLVTRNGQYQYRLIAVISNVPSQSVQTQVQVRKGLGQGVGPVVSQPAGPAVLLASPESNGIELSWVDRAAGSSTYVIGRRTTYGSSGYQIIASLPAGATSFKDTTAQATWEYDYYVQAVTPGGAASVAATVRIRAEEPAIQWLLLANAA